MRHNHVTLGLESAKLCFPTSEILTLTGLGQLSIFFFMWNFLMFPASFYSWAIRPLRFVFKLVHLQIEFFFFNTDQILHYTGQNGGLIQTVLLVRLSHCVHIVNLIWVVVSLYWQHDSRLIARRVAKGFC